jgi:hypothetical protein
MPDEYESTTVIREYDNTTQALADQAALRAAGIEALLSGDVPNAASFHWLAGRLNYAPVQLVVPVSQREQAEQILQNETPPEEGWEESAEEAIDGWLCLNCDTVMKEEEEVCTGCGTPRSEQPEEDD